MSEYVGKINELPEALGNFMPNSSKKVVFGPTHFWPDYVLRCFEDVYKRQLIGSI